MGVHLVTGKAGSAHITGDNWAALNAAIVGTGDYIAAGIGSKMAATLATTNKVHVDDGLMFMQGRQIMVEEGGVDLVIENGTQGQKRNDLVVARYEKTDAGIESATLKVVKGTPTGGTPADPALTKGDVLSGSASVNEVALYRIALNGITPSEPVRLVEEIQSAKDAWDSICPMFVRRTFTFPVVANQPWIRPTCGRPDGYDIFAVVHLRSDGTVAPPYVERINYQTGELRIWFDYASNLQSISFDVIYIKKDYATSQ